MKKFASLVATVLLLAMTLSLSVHAGPGGIIENPPIDLPNVSPTIDGLINGDEGWSQVAHMNYDTLGFFWYVNPLTMKGEVQFAWDENNFYYCATIIDGIETYHEITGELIPAETNQFIYSTGPDYIDSGAENGDVYGYDGDIFGISLDPLGKFIEYGYVGNTDFAPRYLIGLFEGDVAKMYRGMVNEGDITDQVQVAGHKIDGGWCLEAAIPWDIIIKDIEDMSFGEIVLDKAEMLAADAHIRVGAMYHDRFYDTEAEEVSTWGRFITTPTVMCDGNLGNGASGFEVRSLGINLYVDTAPTTPDGGDDTTAPNDTPIPDDTTTAPSGDDTTPPAGGDDTTPPAGDNTQAGNDTTAPTDTSYVDVTDGSGNVVTDASGNKVTSAVVTTKAPNKGKPTTNTTGGSAQTLDIAIVAAVGALVSSGIGFVATKKRK